MIILKNGTPTGFQDRNGQEIKTADRIKHVVDGSICVIDKFARAVSPLGFKYELSSLHCSRGMNVDGTYFAKLTDYELTDEEPPKPKGESVRPGNDGENMAPDRVRDPRNESLKKENWKKVRKAAEMPELRESEDERITRAINNMLPFIPDEAYTNNGVTKEDVVRWLEKQKEQKHPNGCFTCDEYKKGYEEGRRNGFTAGYNKAMKEVEQKEQKPAEWSEEDERIITALTKALIGSDSAEKIMLFDGVTIEMVSDWLKSLRPQGSKDSLQTHWKPSEVCYGAKGDPDPAGVWKPSEELKKENWKKVRKAAEMSELQKYIDKLLLEGHAVDVSTPEAQGDAIRIKLDGRDITFDEIKAVANGITEDDARKTLALQDYQDEDLADELRARGYHGEIRRTKTIII